MSLESSSDDMAFDAVATELLSSLAYSARLSQALAMTPDLLFHKSASRSLDGSLSSISSKLLAVANRILALNSDTNANANDMKLDETAIVIRGVDDAWDNYDRVSDFVDMLLENVVRIL